VLLAATTGSARHAMVVDDQMRPLFGFFRAIPAPTWLFAAPEDWAGVETSKRIERAAAELAAPIISGVGGDIAGGGWGGYQLLRRQRHPRREGGRRRRPHAPCPWRAVTPRRTTLGTPPSSSRRA
jgi:hypothetical protein